MLLDKTEVKYLLLAVLGRKSGSRTEKYVLKKFIHRANYSGPLPEPKLELTIAECSLLYNKMLATEFIPRDDYEGLQTILKKIREFSEIS